MGGRGLVFAIAAASVLTGACAKQVDDGGACFASYECNGGSICAATVYGNFCMAECDSETILCRDGQACLQSSELGAAGAGGGGGMGGSTGEGGMGGFSKEEIWVCVPGGRQLATSAGGFVERDIGQRCDYSLECVRGALCVCIPGATCSGEGQNGPTCQRVCDPSEINQCPRVADIQPECTALEDGRGFCDLTTITLEP